ncbi:MAG TPA: hypothetical protein VI197_23905 [Polyangiaceae bacterium]
MILALALAGCSTGADLDTPYAEYAPEPVGPSTSTSTSSTTSGVGACDDSNVTPALQDWCSGPSCHGNVNQQYSDAFWLFSPARSTELLNRPAAAAGCSAELIIDTVDPEASLLITSLRGTSPCGIEMPKGFALSSPEQQACIEEWALGLAVAAE